MASSLCPCSAPAILAPRASFSARLVHVSATLPLAPAAGPSSTRRTLVKLAGPRLAAWALSAPRAVAAMAAGRAVCMASSEMDLTEENIETALIDVREDLGALFDETVGMTGRVTLADLDGPTVVLRLQGRFWHERSMVLLRVGHYLQTRIPEILEVVIEDEAQLDDSPEAYNA